MEEKGINDDVMSDTRVGKENILRWLQLKWETLLHKSMEEEDQCSA